MVTRGKLELSSSGNGTIAALRQYEPWSVVALFLAGIAVLLATGIQGRSGLMGGGLVLSGLLIAHPASRPIGYLGGAANLFLLIGDFFTSGVRSPLVATLVAFGYVLLVVWFAWMAWLLMSRWLAGHAPRPG